MDEPRDDERPPDVVAIMREIRESIQMKRARGLYTDEEVDSMLALRLRAYAEEAKIDPKLLDRLLHPSHDWNIAADYIVRSHRGGLKAALIVVVKKLVRPLVRLYTDHLFKRQAQLNQYFFHLLQNAVRDAARLQIELQALRRRCDQLEAAAAKHGDGEDDTRSG